MSVRAPFAAWAIRRYSGPRIVDLLEASARRKAALRASRESGSGGDDDSAASHDDRRARILVVLALIVGLIGIIGSWMWIATSDARALRALPAAQRAEVLHNALCNLTDVCDPFPPRSLATFCREQAEIATSFEECDAACLAIARRHLNQPVR